MTTLTGIDAIGYYIPKLFMPIEYLAEARNIEYAKLNKGLGLKAMTLTDVDEDSVSMAANALLSLIMENKINPSEIGRIYVGTESALDAAKPTASYAVGIVEKLLEADYGKRCFKNCDLLDMTFACIGAVDALHNSLDWVKSGENRKAIVIASDFAKYELASTGEYTQGAGAVALLVSKNPSVISIGENWGVSSESVNDFFKPRREFSKLEILKNALHHFGLDKSIDDLEAFSGQTDCDFWGHPDKIVEVFRETPVFDGVYSNDCYQNRINEALEHFKSQASLNVLKDWQHLVFHLPYAFQGRRMILPIWLGWMKANNRLHELEEQVGETYTSNKEWMKKASKTAVYKDFVKNAIASGELASQQIGNMYTASIFMSLLSTLADALKNNRDITGDKIGFFSYGSGSKSKVFEGEVKATWKDKIVGQKLFEELDNRIAVDFTTYEKLHQRAILKPITKGGIRLREISEQKNTEGYRVYGA